MKGKEKEINSTIYCLYWLLKRKKIFIASILQNVMRSLMSPLTEEVIWKGEGVPYRLEKVWSLMAKIHEEVHIFCIVAIKNDHRTGGLSYSSEGTRWTPCFTGLKSQCCQGCAPPTDRRGDLSLAFLCSAGWSSFLVCDPFDPENQLWSAESLSVCTTPTWHDWHDTAFSLPSWRMIMITPGPPH